MSLISAKSITLAWGGTEVASDLTFDIQKG